MSDRTHENKGINADSRLTIVRFLKISLKQLTIHLLFVLR